MAAQFADLPEAHGEHHRDRAPLRLPPEEAQTHPAGIRAGIRPVAGRGTARRRPKRGSTRRLAGNALAAEEKVYRERLAYELAIINRMGFPGYFLIVSDFMKWTQGAAAFRSACAARAPPRWWPGRWTSPISIPCASACSSSASSIPNASRCRTSTSISARSGATRWCAMSATNTAPTGSPISSRWVRCRRAPRCAMPGRVLQMPLGLVDRIAKLIPNPPGKPMSLQDAIESEPRLQAIAEAGADGPAPVRDHRARSKGFTATPRPIRPGVVIGDRPLDEILPLYRDPRSDMPVTQFDYEDAEKAGLVKFDFLGLKTLTVIAKAEELLKKRGIAARYPDHRFHRRRHLRDAVPRRQRRRVPAGRRGHARPDAQDEARPHQRSGGAGGALPARPDGFDSQIHRLQERQGGGGISPSAAGADPAAKPMA